MQDKMWSMFVPERGIRFGDQRFWILLIAIGVLHTINEYRDAQKVVEPDLPAGAARRLPDGRLLMVDGSISAKGTDTSSHAPTLHQEKTAAELAPGVINNMKRSIKDAV